MTTIPQVQPDTSIASNQFFLCHELRHTWDELTTRNRPAAANLARNLAMRLRSQRPLRAGSLIVTIFGDSIMPRGGAISLGSLIRLAAPFGLNERLVRTATARLAQEGWVRSRRAGNLSEYRLSDSGRERFAEATRRIYGGSNPHWSGRWTLVVLPAMPAAARHRLRKELTWQGFGELAGGVFAHPDRQVRGVELPLAGAESAGALIFEADLGAHGVPARLVDRAWDLADLAQRYRRFVKRFESAAAALRNQPADPQTAFILRTLLIHEYRRLHLRDPLLPKRLLPANWPGHRAEQLCREVYEKVFAGSESHLSRVAARLAGALPPPDPAVMRRFGGLKPTARARSRPE
jgi:phenylacetic acid degradation operon negative regulatory protein